MLRVGRDASILAAAKRDGTTVDDLAKMFGLSRRTIFRVLERHRGKRGGRGC
jgi:lambda repressor-like predicted transcriptional regulator